METTREHRSAIVACPDARPPAYQAVVGLGRAGLLDAFVTASYYDPRGRLARLARRLAPARLARIERWLLRRHDAGIPSDRVWRAHVLRPREPARVAHRRPVAASEARPCPIADGSLR